VNSFHGSAIVEPPEHSEVLVTDEDNYVESWILDNVAAVVWHPEREKDHWIPDEIKTLLGA
jgi:gamma-glutamyl-gamma-aminobutyrate hydrolase PuuD